MAESLSRNWDPLESTNLGNTTGPKHNLGESRDTSHRVRRLPGCLCSEGRAASIRGHSVVTEKRPAFKPRACSKFANAFYLLIIDLDKEVRHRLRIVYMTLFCYLGTTLQTFTSMPE